EEIIEPVVTDGLLCLQCIRGFHVLIVYVCCVFFFQAEDGIRDRTVTGVQTCTLPISVLGVLAVRERGNGEYAEDGEERKQAELRSEERRVGKECRARWATDH